MRCLVFSVLGTKFQNVINVPLAFSLVYHIKHRKPSGSSRLGYVLSSNSLPNQPIGCLGSAGSRGYAVD